MARYLRQSEVDEILKYVEREKSSLADAGVTAGTVVRSHDFAAPAPVSKEALRSIHAIHESFLYSMVTSLSAHMRAMVEIDLISIDQMGYQEYLLSLNNPTVLCVFGMQPLGGDGVIEVHLPLVSAMVDRLFGGEGDLPARSRELTLIEQAVLSRIFSQSVQHLQKAWGEPEHLGLSLKNIERNPQFLQVLSPSEVVLLVTFEVRVEQSNGLMSVCYPLMSLESILKRIEDRHSTHRVTPWGRSRARIRFCARSAESTWMWSRSWGRRTWRFVTF